MSIKQIFLDAMAKARDVATATLKYATDYFEVIYKTRFTFWDMPEVPSGGNILTGAFASTLIFAARHARSLDTDSATVVGVLAMAIFYVALISGLALIFDPKVENKTTNFMRIVSIVCVGITIGAGILALDSVLPWMQTVHIVADDLGLNASLIVFAPIFVASLAATVAMLANTVFQTSASAVFGSPRTLLWVLSGFMIIAIGLHIVMFPPFE